MKAITLDYQKENREFLVLKSYSTDYLITSFDFKKTEHLVQSLFNVFLNFIPHKESAFFSIKTTESRSGKDFDACLGKFFTNQCRELLDHCQCRCITDIQICKRLCRDSATSSVAATESHIPALIAQVASAKNQIGRASCRERVSSPV